MERAHGATSASRVFSACAWVDREDDGMPCFRAPCPRKGKSSSSGRDCFYIFYRVDSMSVSCLCTDEASGWLRRFIQGELSPEEAAERICLHFGFEIMEKEKTLDKEEEGIQLC